jgi:phytoene dehydrogenase-like protein
MKNNNPKYDCIVVGGGIAGLTAAAYLSRAEKKTLLIEKNNEFGGLVSSFQRDGFHFEGGVRALINGGIILPMLEELGIKLDFVRSKVSVGIENDVLHIEDINSVDEYKNLLIKHFPESKEQIENFIQIVLKIMKHLDVLYGIENPIFKNIPKDKEYLFKKLLPWLPKFITTIGKINRLNGPVEEYLENIIDDASLRDIISQHFFKGTPTFFALSYFSLYIDYFYPVEGVGKIAESVEEKIKEYDGELLPNTTINSVNIKDSYVVDKRNKKYYYKNLIWAADLITFYDIIQSDSIPENKKRKYEQIKSKFKQTKGSESVFSLYLEVDLPIEYFKEISYGHFFYSPSKKGLNGLHKNELVKLIENWDGESKTAVIDWFNRFLDLNTFEISIPGLKNKSLAPENKTGVMVSFICDYEIFGKLKEYDWYDEVKTLIENKMISILSESIYPNLKDRIIKQFSFTPISFKNRIASTDGAIVGWSFEKPLPVLNKINKSGKSVITPFDNIYQAGQWAYSPAGVPMSILTGKLAADKICK